LHKSDIGGVILGISSDLRLTEAIATLKGVAAREKIQAQGILLESMQTFDHELLLGLRRDARFGPTLTLGRGGVEVELEADAVTRLLPLDDSHIEEMLNALRSAPLLHGFRGGKPADICAV